MALTDLSTYISSIGDALKLISDPQRGILGPLAGLIGAYFIFQGLVTARQQATEQGGGHDKKSWWNSIFFGLIFMNFWQVSGMMTDQLALSGNILSPAPPSGYLSQVWSSIKSIMFGFGAISVFKGLLLAKSAGEGTANGHQSPGWGAMWHIIGGLILMKL